MTVPDLAALREAYAVTSATTQTTPLFESAALAGEAGVSRIFVKPESLQWAGSFKIRGAYWRLTRLSQPDAYAGMGTSIDRGEIGEISVMPVGPKSICDGLMARAPGNAPFEAVNVAGVSGMSVSDKSVSSAMRFAFEKLKLVWEPSRAVGLAAMLDHSLPVDDETALIIATGGNVSLADFMGHVSGA